MIWKNNTSNASFVDVFGPLTADSVQMGVPALVYFITKILSFVGLQNLDPAVYAIVTQLKLLSTAVFSVLFLGTEINPPQVARAAAADTRARRRRCCSCRHPIASL